jgi:DNA/RNA endonuclease YhcR with UshA esterase domain
MRLATLLLLTLPALTVPAMTLGQESPAKPLTPVEAAKKLEMKVTVEMEVKSTGGNNNNYLNSHADYKDAANFTIFIPRGALAKFAAAKIDKPVDYYKGKTIQVTGTVTLFEQKPQIRVDDPVQIKVVEKN